MPFVGVPQIGADHLDVKIDAVVGAMASLLSSIVGRTPRFRVHLSAGTFTPCPMCWLWSRSSARTLRLWQADGGTGAENLALQNIQARLRMVLAFFLAQLRPWSRGRSGFLLVLGTANVDECLRGYLTKCAVIVVWRGVLQ